jgi:putative oxygen-independent coproporphyrinogen III oxidase
LTAAHFRFEPARGFGVYVHWPYCTRICPYCDFNVYAAKDRDREPMLAALLEDLKGWRARSGARQVDSVFLGGGTPSLLAGEEAGRLLAAIDGLWGLAGDAEITLEANPDDDARFREFSAAGVNRLSLGVQSLRNESLAFLGRTHDAAGAIAALEQARALFRSVSIDLIYARPGQRPQEWEAELGEAMRQPVDHLSLYQLTVEPGTPFGRQVRRGQWRTPGEDISADLYDLTQAMCADAGFDAYEISNHARGRAHQSRHNRIYWACGDWAGVGPGAHGRLTADGQRLAIEAHARPAQYQTAVAEAGTGWDIVESLTPLDEARERIAMGLRVAEGIDQGDFEAPGMTLDAGQLADLEGLGLLRREGGRIALTASGRLAADRIASQIAP